ncbi:MAG: Sulfate transporter/antisigma-factor antagonist [Labilithrix sp.]|nr:Sulfate transporter/antisigma-factor antagonist [Labilithrix sp.]
MLRVHDEPTSVTIDVAGPATMLDSAAVHETASERMARGIDAVRVDLRDCTAMDSTFLGTLLSLQRQLVAAGGTLTLVAPSARVLELLAQMGLEDFYAVEVSDRTDVAWREIVPSLPRVATLRRLVIDAHDELAHVPGPAAESFRAVVEELRRSDPGEQPDSDV